MGTRTKTVVAIGGGAVALATMMSGAAGAATPTTDVRLSNDSETAGGYVSNYTLVTGTPYTDSVLEECSKARGRQNEPSVSINPRDPQVMVGSSNDYCGTYNLTEPPVPVGPIWLGYYRSENGGTTFQSSLMPGYPGDTSPYAARSGLRTASSGDPVTAWDRDGRLFMGAETSEDSAGTIKGFGDVGVATFVNPAGPGGPTKDDGKEFAGSVIVGKGSSAPGTGGKFNDKTAIEVDRTIGSCSGNVYFSWSRFTGGGGVSIQFARSTDHGRTFSTPQKISAAIKDVQFPDIAVTGNGHVYVTYRQFGEGKVPNGIVYSKSTDCGRSFSAPRLLRTFTPYDAQDIAAPSEWPVSAPDDPPSMEAEDGEAAPGGTSRDCGDGDAACASGYTFFRRDTQIRATADQKDVGREYVYLVYDPSKPGTSVPSGSTYGSIASGTGSQSGVYFIRLNGATGRSTAPKLVSSSAVGHQLFPDIAADAGVLHLIWWDSRNDACYSPTRPVGNCADRTVVPSLDVYATRSTDRGSSFATSTKVTDVPSNPNFEQFAGRTVPFAGDYLWVDAVGATTYGVWTDWRNTVPGTDQRETDGDEGADVLQCRTQGADGTWGSDTCPRDGGLDQDIYGDLVP